MQPVKNELTHMEEIAQAAEERKNLMLEIEQLNRTIFRQKRKIEELEGKMETAQLCQRILEKTVKVKFVNGK